MIVSSEKKDGAGKIVRNENNHIQIHWKVDDYVYSKRRQD